MRKFLLLLLLFAGWAAIFSPLFPGTTALTESFSPLFSSITANPSSGPLPQPWQDAQKVQVRSASGLPETGALPAERSSASQGCPGVYVVQGGDTLGEIAKSCGVSLADLLSANPAIPNPNHVFVGQQINLPDLTSGRGGGGALYDSASPSQPGGFAPGSAIQIDAAGLPANASVRVGLGFSTSGYYLLGRGQADANGHVALTFDLPADAQPGETGFIMVTTQGTPTVQRVSDPFTIAGN